MNPNDKGFPLYIEKLRLSRKLSREDFCDEIISLSQYKRYLKGDTSIPHSILVQMANKLQISVFDLQYGFFKENDQEYSFVTKIFRYASKNKFNEAQKLIVSYKDKPFFSSYNQTYFNYVKIKTHHGLEMISNVQALEQYTDLINFPECTHKNSFNFVEVCTILEISKLNASKGDYSISDVLYRIMIGEEITYTSSEDAFFLPSIYSMLCTLIGMQGDHEKVLEIAEAGISYCMSRDTFNSLAHLFYFASLAYKYLGNIEQALEYAKKAFYTVKVENNLEKYKVFKSDFEQEFKITVDELLHTNS